MTAIMATGQGEERTVREVSPFLTYKQASAYCNVERTTLWRAVKAGRLKASGPGSAVRFHIRDLDEFMGAGRDDGR